MDVPTLNMQKSSEFESPIIEVIKNRRSRRAYSDQPVEKAKIAALFEVGSSRVDLQACKLEYSIVSPK